MPVIFEREQEAAQSPRRRGIDPPEPRRFRVWSWFALAAFMGVLGAGAWSVQSRLNGHESVIAQWKRWPEAMEPVRQQLASAEQRIARLRDEVASMNGREQDLEKRMAQNLEQARRTAQDLGVALRSRIDREVQSIRKEAAGVAAARDQSFEQRLREIENQRRAETSRTTELSQEVARLESRVATLDRELDQIRTTAAREPAELRREIRRQSDRIDRVASFHNRERTRFEVALGSSSEIAPGVMLHITRIDPRYRRFHGWLQLINDGSRFLWLRDQSILQTIAFYTGRNALRHDLVVTDLTAGGVTGYLIFPPRGELERVESASTN